MATDTSHLDHEASEPNGSANLARYAGKTCFVIMPFGTKTHPFTNEAIDFDKVYETIVCEALRQVLDEESFTRSDSATAAGLIHSEMIDDIISSDLAIVDITTANPNVMYELGIRHAAKKSGTIVIKRKGDEHQIPFNIGGIRAFEYPDGSEPEETAAFLNVLVSAVKGALDGGPTDSLVHGLHRGLNVTRRPKPLRRRETHIYSLSSISGEKNQREICIITGDIAEVTDVDIWVNPENTAMQMGRFYDDSVSASIRYFGAQRDTNGFVVKDIIADELRKAVASRTVAQPGAILITKSGHLRAANGVKKIMHVAAQYGEPSKGYQTVRNAAGCISACLKTLDKFHQTQWAKLRDKRDYDSILFPLFGVKSSERMPEEVAKDLIEAAVLHFEKHPESLIDRVYFLAYTDADLALCEQALKWLNLEKTDKETVRNGRLSKGRKQLIRDRRTKSTI